VIKRETPADTGEGEAGARLFDDFRSRCNYLPGTCGMALAGAWPVATIGAVLPGA
jgi:hypothetical protein